MVKNRKVVDWADHNAKGVLLISDNNPTIVEVGELEQPGFVSLSIDDKRVLVAAAAVDGLIEGLTRAKERALEAA